MSNKNIIITVVAIALLAGVGFWYWSQKRTRVRETLIEMPAAIEVKDGLGAEVFKKTSNPLSNELPETNPFQVKINPFK